MTYSEPSQQWQTQQHRHMLRFHPTAFAELCEAALPHLITFLRSQFPYDEPHLHEMVAIDCLLDYQAKPERFDPEKLTLFGYLRMAARRDMLNAIDKKRRREQRLMSIDDPASHLQLSDEEDAKAQAELESWLQQHTDLSSQEILEALDSELEPADKKILMLMLEGVRESERYAEVMEISHWEEQDMRREVKRAKDRLAKQLRRFGERLDRS